MSIHRLTRAPIAWALLGVLTMGAPQTADADEPHTQGESRPAKPRTEVRTLSDFTPATADLGWYVVNDGVMGGRSQGGFERKGGAIHFAGTTNTNGGGFSSIRTRQLELDLGGFDGIRVRVLGDGRRYTWRLTTDARWRGRSVGYWADFETVKGEWTVADIPWKRFRPQWRGRMLDGQELDPRRIRGMGLMIYDKLDGPFALRLDRVEAYRTRVPFSLRDHRGKSRVLVAYAPAAEDDHLQKLLTDVRATRDAFTDRDMLLIVILGNGEAVAGDTRLIPDEAHATLRAAEIVPKSSFALRLIGKDGGVKHTSSSFTGMQELYDLIDTMPMRRAEKKRKAK